MHFLCTWQSSAHANSARHSQGSPTWGSHSLPSTACVSPHRFLWCTCRHKPVPRMLLGPTSGHSSVLQAPSVYYGERRNRWFPPNFEIFKPWGWMNQKLRIFCCCCCIFFFLFSYSFFFLQTGYIFKTCHPQTAWNTKVSALFLSTDIIWNHLKGQIICPLISQTARVDISGSF